MLRPIFRHTARLFIAFSSVVKRLVFQSKFPTLKIGKRVHFGKGCEVFISGQGRIILGDKTALVQQSRLFSSDGILNIGDNVHIGIGTIISAMDKITIGHDTLIAEYVTIRDQDHKVEAGKITAQNGFVSAPIHIGDNVWIGAKATILKGVTIGDNVVIGANSVVTKSIPSNTIAAGIPAKPIRQI